MQIKLTAEESEEYFYNALCNGLGYTTSGYGLSLDYSDEDYADAKTKLANDNPKSLACFEDVLMEMLRMGKTLTMVDDEGEGDHDDEEITESRLAHTRLLRDAPLPVCPHAPRSSPPALVHRPYWCGLAPRVFQKPRR